MKAETVARPVLDPRHIANGLEIPSENYCDQPYVVKTDDGAWLCEMTTGPGREGRSGQHVVSMRSTDRGRTWSVPVDVEPSDGPEASYATMVKTPSGRIYIFYNHNTDDLREVPAENPPYSDGLCRRVDSLGYHVFKYSDDGGQSWSTRRYVVPIREMAVDRENITSGRIRFGWNVGRPFIRDGDAYISFHKTGNFGLGFFTRSEGVLVKSPNLLTEPDPEQITWETLPDGDAGLRTPPGGGPVAEEHSYSVLSDGSLYAVYRTIDGHPACAYSRDGGHTWGEPRYERFASGRLIKHPRAANFAWKCSNGNFLYWFHNHGGVFIRRMSDVDFAAPGNPYMDRNPVWLCGGTEADSPEGKVIRWSEPEIILYHDDPYVGMSYPDLIEDDGRFFVTETQKSVARVHELDRELVEGLWRQAKHVGLARSGLVLDLPDEPPAQCPMPQLPRCLERDTARPDLGARDLRSGFTLDLWLQLDVLEAGRVLLDSRTDCGRGLCLRTSGRGAAEIVLNDGRTESRWACDPGALRPGVLHHLAAIVDGGPKVITFVVDGALCDGGDARQFGWGRFSPNLREANGAPTLRIGREVKGLRIYDRALRTSEAIGNWHTGANDV